MIKDIKVVILAGGFGTRLSEFTKTIPKPMVKVKCNILHNNYIDYLSLFKVSGQWKIISKVFHMNPGIQTQN